jgi:hypothetical protein
MKKLILFLFLAFGAIRSFAQPPITAIHNNLHCCIEVDLICSNNCVAVCTTTVAVPPGGLSGALPLPCGSCTYEFADVRIIEQLPNLFPNQGPVCGNTCAGFPVATSAANCAANIVPTMPLSCNCSPTVGALYEVGAGILHVNPTYP